ncbi:hypothetical protein [Nevskia soli]|uniref:hypothetical protein n=1 Tax=Nevskia soli TaxID=418856 RepID=UPI0015D89D60|nr:hypothetical protein [Nevskia soli]
MAGASAAFGHVGSPDVYFDAQAGPYSLFVTVQPPPVIPGVAQIQIRTTSPGVHAMNATPLGLTGEAARHAPVADALRQSKQDPQYFTGAVWLMAAGSMQVRVVVDGDKGPATVSVPLPAIAQRTLTMPTGLGFFLFAILCVLVVGLAGIIGAAATEAELAPGVAPTRQARVRQLMVVGGALAVLIFITWLGNSWWTAEAATYQANIYKPLQMTPSLSGGVLRLKVTDPGWLPFRKSDDFVPDHGHLMHLYLIRQPELDRVYHLHPDMTGAGVFELQMPSIAPGRYKLYADVVHEDGFPETLTASMNVPESSVTGRALDGDDAAVSATPASEVHANTTEFLLPDGYKMRFDAPAAWVAKRAELFRFELLDPAGHAPQDMRLYMGMLGHAAFVKTDGTVFAHIHPNGSVAMAAFMMSRPDGMGSMNMDGTEPAALPNAVSFPYGFPSAGHYRIFVQMKHGDTVETGAFDAFVGRS